MLEKGLERARELVLAKRRIADARKQLADAALSDELDGDGCRSLVGRNAASVLEAIIYLIDDSEWREISAFVTARADAALERANRELADIGVTG